MTVRSSARVLLVALGLGAMVAVVVAVLGTAKVVDVEAETFDPGKISDTPLVVARTTSGGFDVFGVQLDSPDRWISVGVAPPRGCLVADEDGSEVLVGYEGCESYAHLAGPVSGGGTKVDGTRWIEIRLEVDRACFEASRIGDAWPVPACTSG